MSNINRFNYTPNFNPNASLIRASSNAPAGFQLQMGQMATQGKAFIAKYDADKDGTLNFNEYQAAGGNLTDGLQSTVSSPELAKALFACHAGPSGTLNAAEWARSIRAFDDNFDGIITQAELDKNIAARQDLLKIDPNLYILDEYLGAASHGKAIFGQSIIQNGAKKELDPELQIAQDLVKPFTETEKANLEKIKAISEQYYPKDNPSDFNNLGLISKLKAGYSERLDSSVFPAGHPYYSDPRAKQAYIDQTYVLQATLKGELGANRMLQNGRLALLRQLPPEHPQIPMLLQDIAQIQQDIDRSGNQLNKVTAVLQQEKARGSNPSSLIGKVMAQLNGMNTPEAMNLLDTLGSIYTVDMSASPEEIDKHLDMMPRLVETVFKTNRYVVGDDLSPKTSIPEAQSAQAWGTKTTNPASLDSTAWLSFNSTTTEDNNGSGLTYLP
ncbi:MAG: hypothetical protein HEQ32_05620 [Vampirovibrio sp.]